MQLAEFDYQECIADMKKRSLKSCEKTVHAAIAMIALAVCSLPYRYAENSGTVTWQERNTLVIADCSRCAGKTQRARQGRLTGFKKPVLQIRLPEAVPGRSMP